MTTLINPWVILGGLAVAISLWLWGDAHGHSAEKEVYELAQANAAIEAANKQQALQKVINIAASQYEDEKAKNDLLLSKAEEDLHHEAKISRDYATCHTGIKFVQSYNKLAGNGTSTSSKPLP
jgi:hypothetical protein